jgi:cytochrome c oxidase subunit 2
MQRLSACLILPTSLAMASTERRTVSIVASKFKFEPSEIALKVGQTVTLEIRSLDFPHGFNIPDLDQRVDLLPGQVVRMTLKPQDAGTLDFLCDNFCGEGHEGMHGRFLVTN